MNGHNKKSLCVVLCSKGYPDKFENNIEIKKFRKIKIKLKIIFYFMQEQKNNEKKFAVGGRVLNFVSLSDDF